MPKLTIDEKFWADFEAQLISCAHEMSVSNDQRDEAMGRFYKFIGPAARRFMAAEQERGVEPARTLCAIADGSATLCAILTLIFVKDGEEQNALDATAALMSTTVKSFRETNALNVETKGGEDEQSTTS